MNEALLLIGHGSVRYPDAAGDIQFHAESLRAAGRFSQVETAVLNGTPSVATALGRMSAGVIRVVPCFMEDGYFTRVAVPRAIAAARHAGAIRGAIRGAETPAAHSAAEPRIILCPPVGVHDGMAGVIERQALVACAGLGSNPHNAAVVIVGHGSARAPGRVLALHRHAARVASTTLFARVEAACLEEPPFVADTLASLRTHPVVVIGFFAGQGGHVRDDLPALIAAEQRARGDAGPDVLFHASVINDPALVAIVLDQAESDPPGE
jgi:sirohydrochlorin cobaltochelatase